MIRIIGKPHNNVNIQLSNSLLSQAVECAEKKPLLDCENERVDVEGGLLDKDVLHVRPWRLMSGRRGMVAVKRVLHVLTGRPLVLVTLNLDKTLQHLILVFHELLHALSDFCSDFHLSSSSLLPFLCLKC